MANNRIFKASRGIAEHGVEEAARRSPALFKGINLYKGRMYLRNVATAFDMNYIPLQNFSKPKST
jgi:alanine dehydrogenase